MLFDIFHLSEEAPFALATSEIDSRFRHLLVADKDLEPGVALQKNDAAGLALDGVATGGLKALHLARGKLLFPGVIGACPNAVARIVELVVVAEFRWSRCGAEQRL